MHACIFQKWLPENGSQVASFAWAKVSLVFMFDHKSKNAIKVHKNAFSHQDKWT